MLKNTSDVESSYPETIVNEGGYTPRYDQLYPELFKGLDSEQVFSVMNNLADHWLEGDSPRYKSIKVLTDIEKGLITVEESIAELKAEIAEVVKEFDEKAACRNRD